MLQTRKFALCQEGLKLIAVITMLIDHVGLALCKDNLLMRGIGRLAFPIYVFLLVEGFYHTGNYLRYLGRLALFALLSEIPFDFMVSGAWTSPQAQNVMVTLLLALICLWLLEAVSNLHSLLRVLASGVILMAIGRMADGVGCDYGAFGIWLAAIFYFTWRLPWWRYLLQAVGILLLCLLWYGTLWNLEALAALAILPIALYGGERKLQSKAVQYGFYAFYPAHMFIIAILAYLQ